MRAIADYTRVGRKTGSESFGETGTQRRWATPAAATASRDQHGTVIGGRPKWVVPGGRPKWVEVAAGKAAIQRVRVPPCQLLGSDT